jgi:hypothetical protein
MKSRLEFHLILFLIAFVTVLLVRWGSGPPLPSSTERHTRQERPVAAASRSGETEESQANFSRLD